MPPLLPIALVFTFSAFLCYSVSIWSGQFSAHLRGWHLVTLWAGFACDVGGSGLMTIIAGGVILNLHGLAGYLAISLMLALAIWGTRLYRLSQQRYMIAFHRVSALVWVIWMIPLVNGFIRMVAR